MVEENIALQLFIDAVLSNHHKNKLNDSPEIDDDYVDFTDDELIEMVKALWVDRYTTTQRDFEQKVGQIILKRMPK